MQKSTACDAVLRVHSIINASTDNDMHDGNNVILEATRNTANISISTPEKLLTTLLNFLQDFSHCGETANITRTNEPKGGVNAVGVP